MSEKKATLYQLNKEKNRYATLSVVSNSVLLAAKLTVGLMIGSVSVISEGIHSGIDLLAAILAYFSVHQSSKPPDAEHYYGHGKYENVSGAVEAILILVAAGLIIREATLRLINGVEIEEVNLGIIVMGVSVIVNYFVSSRLIRAAKRTDSIALEADAWHLRTDVLTSLGILLGLVIIRFTGILILDPIMAILVALFITRAGIKLTWKSVRDLIDVRLPVEEENKIKAIIQKYSGSFFEFHEMRTRKAGSDRFVDFHLVVCKDANIEEAHELADKMEQEIIREFPRASVIIHLEPCEISKRCGICGKGSDSNNGGSLQE